MTDATDQNKEKEDINEVKKNPLSSSGLEASHSIIATSFNQEIREKEFTNVFYTDEEVFRNIQFAYTNCKMSLDVSIDRNAPSIIIEISEYKELFRTLKRNKVKIRIVTEVNKDNLQYCKQLVKDFDVNMRHLHGINGNFGIFDSRWYLAAHVVQEAKPIPQLIVSNVKSIVEQNRYIFDTLWSKAVSAEQRIREIEEGILPAQTYVIDNPKDMLNYVVDMIDHVKTGLSNCTTIDSFKILDQNESLFQAYKNLLSRYKEGKVRDGVRWITQIEDKRQNIILIKKFLNMGIKIRHISNLPPLKFAISERQFVSTVEEIRDKKIYEKLLHNSEPLYIQHFQLIFEDLWNSAMDAQERIKQIEKGEGSETTKLIESPHQARLQLLSLTENAKEEILVLFPSVIAVKRKQNMGLMQILKQKNQEGVKIRILSPLNDEVNKILYFHDSKAENPNPSFLIREVVKQKDIKRTIVMVDKKYVLTIEPKDDSQDVFEEAVGTSIYSSSKSTVLSYISIFENLWDQSELLDKLRLTNKMLVESEELEREFINTAAHELRTPTQAITGYIELDDNILTDLLNNRKEMTEQDLERVLQILHKNHEVILRSATRLENLINNLLDVARIDSNQKNLIILYKEDFDLISEIRDIAYIQLQPKLKDKNIKVNFINETLNESCFVYADRSRVNQVLTNLFDNAIKFSKEDTSIDIMIQGDYPKSNENQKSSDHNRTDKGLVYIAISDSGKGISSNILPKLFEKFITNSDTGTGLGLYISKKLVEAMGGRIWAFNNNDGVGSTFVFGLPLADQNNSLQ